MFNIGDKVVCKDNIGADTLSIGEVYTVSSIHNNGNLALKGLLGLRYNPSRFVLFTEEGEQNENESKETKVNNILKRIKHWGEVDVTSELRETERHLRNCIDEKQSALDHVSRMSNKIKQYMIKIEMLKGSDKGTKNFTNDIASLLEHPLVENIIVSGNTMYIMTDYIDIYDEQGNKFRGNKYKLIMDFKDMRTIVRGEDNSRCREGFWSNRDPHPHVSGESGNPCWGDAGSMLTLNMNEYELYASFIVVLNFLQQVNTNDSAGKYISNWDAINEDGEEIENIHKSGNNHCCACEERVTAGELKMCLCCDDEVCGDCRVWISGSEGYVCRSCYDDDYDECRRCGHTDHVDNLQFCAYCGVCHCEHCSENDGDFLPSGNYACSECLTERYLRVSCCEEYALRPTAFSCSSCEKNYHKNCKEQYIREDGVFVCEDCWKGNGEEDEN